MLNNYPFRDIFKRVCNLYILYGDILMAQLSSVSNKYSRKNKNNNHKRSDYKFCFLIDWFMKALTSIPKFCRLSLKWITKRLTTISKTNCKDMYSSRVACGRVPPVNRNSHMTGCACASLTCQSPRTLPNYSGRGPSVLGPLPVAPNIPQRHFLFN